MNKKCEECKYRLIVYNQLCLSIEMDIERKACSSWDEEYNAFEDKIKNYVNFQNDYLKKDLDERNDKCFYCKNRIGVNKSEKHFEEMLKVMEKPIADESKSVIINYLLEKYYEECGEF